MLPVLRELLDRIPEQERLNMEGEKKSLIMGVKIGIKNIA